MTKYTIQLTYKVSTELEIDANSSYEATNKARNIAESSDMNIFNIVDEMENKIITMSD